MHEEQPAPIRLSAAERNKFMAEKLTESMGKVRDAARGNDGNALIEAARRLVEASDKHMESRKDLLEAQKRGEEQDADVY